MIQKTSFGEYFDKAPSIKGGMDSKGAHEFGRENGFWANIRVYKLELNGVLIVRPASIRGGEVQ